MGRMNFKPAARYPADPRVVFMLAFAVFTGLTSLLLQAAPASLEAELPRWGVVVWGFTLASGSLITLIGVARNTLNGIIFEQVGSVMVAVTTLFYSVIALIVVGDDAISPVGLIAAWGFACTWRYFQLQALIKNAYRAQIRKDVEQEFHDELRALDEA